MEQRSIFWHNCSNLNFGDDILEFTSPVMKPVWILYDDACPFCFSCVQLFRKTLKGNECKIRPLQNLTIMKLLDIKKGEYLPEMKVIGRFIPIMLMTNRQVPSFPMTMETKYQMTRTNVLKRMLVGKTLMRMDV